MHSKNLFLIFFIANTLSINVLAQTGFTTKSLVFFKNGTGFVTKSGVVTPKNNAYIWRDNLPKALYGTFWFNAEGTDIPSIRATIDTISTTKPAVSMLEILRANRGKGVTLSVSYTAQEFHEIRGIVDTVSSDGTVVRLKTPTGSRAASADAPRATPFEVVQSGFRTIPLVYIREVFVNPEGLFDLEDKKVVDALHLTFKTPKTAQPLNIMYLQNGLGWVPEYLVEMLDNKTARIILRGVCFNQTDEDFENTDVYFAVGVPNFKTDNKLSPLVLAENMRSFLNLRNDNQDLDAYRGNLFVSNQRATSNRGNFEIENNNSDAIEGEQQQDLFFYTLKNVTIRKGERISFDLMNMTVPLTHKHRIQLNKNEHNKPLSTGADAGFEHKTTATHVLTFPNKTDKPLTTATALLVNAEKQPTQPLSQDILRYTPSGGKGSLVVTTTPDVLAEENYVEVSRQQKAQIFRNTSYDVVRVRGQIAVKNYKKEAVSMEIYKTIEGIMDKTSSPWEMTNTKDAQSYPNAVNNITWKFDLKVGEEKTIVFEYDVLVHW